MDGLAKTCRGHALEDWGRSIGLPAFTGLSNVTSPISGDQTISDAIWTQNIAGTEQTYNPASAFKVYDEMRVGDLTAQGLSNSNTTDNTKLWIYRGSMVAPGDAITDPPDPVFLASAFSSIKAANPLVDYVILDHEGYPNSNGQLTPDGIQYYADLVDIAHDYWTNVAVYGVFPERYPSHFNYPVGHATYESRKANWYARCSLLQPVADRVNAHWPSVYYIGSPATNTTNMQLWIEQHKEICELYGPGKPLIPTIWPRLHSSVDPTIPIVGGTHFRATLDKCYAECDGVAMWLQGGDTFSMIENTDMYTQLLDFIADNSITAVN